jgi:hypothetical protein
LSRLDPVLRSWCLASVHRIVSHETEHIIENICSFLDIEDERTEENISCAFPTLNLYLLEERKVLEVHTVIRTESRANIRIT